MKSFVRTVTAAFALAMVMVQAALAQPASVGKGQISFEYIAPLSLKYLPLVDRLKQFKFLEQITQFISPLRLPHEFSIVALECGTVNAQYVSSRRRVEICYELVEMLERVAPKAGAPAGLTFQQAVIGGLVGSTVHELGHAAFDMLDVPVFGREEDAADQMAIFIAMQFSKDIARIVLNGFSYTAQTFLNRGAPVYFDEHGTGLQRYYNALCLAYGGDPASFRDLVDKGDLPKDRAANCASEYQQVKAAFEKTVLPFVDVEQMKKVQGASWLNLTPQQAAALNTLQQQQKPLFTFSVCNESKVTNAHAALLARGPDDSSKWLVNGWFSIPDGGCTVIGTFYGDRLYFYAMGTNGTNKASWSAQDTDQNASKQCVDPVNAFQVAAGAKCATGQVLVNFSRIDIDPIDAGITWHLSGGK